MIELSPKAKGFYCDRSYFGKCFFFAVGHLYRRFGCQKEQIGSDMVANDRHCLLSDFKCFFGGVFGLDHKYDFFDQEWIIVLQ